MTTGYYKYGMANYAEPRRPNGLPYISRHRIKVEIIEVGRSRTKVRFLEWHVDGRGPGTIASVKNQNVVYNNINQVAEYRLPYKDD